MPIIIIRGMESSDICVSQGESDKCNDGHGALYRDVAHVCQAQYVIECTRDTHTDGLVGFKWMKAMTFIDNCPLHLPNLDASPFHGLLNLIREYNRLDLGMQVFDAMKKRNVVVGSYAANILLGMALRQNKKAIAKRIVDDYRQNAGKNGPPYVNKRYFNHLAVFSKC